MVKEICIHIRDCLFGLFFSPFILFNNVKKKEIVFCECYMKNSLQRFKNNNWGDDLNKHMFEYASGVKIINLPFSKMRFMGKVNQYSLIGSIITFYKLENKIIYGSGIMDPDAAIKGFPKKIISVRGPETRQVLINNGIDCPEQYGDPALLLPCFYIPHISQRRKGGLILNMGTNIKNTEFITDIIDKLNLHLISMTDYSNWTCVIDDICSCNYIISESLHGLIVAETYGIPNVWVEFTDHPKYWNFKYHDYYESIGKKEQIVKITGLSDLENVLKKISVWKKGDINYDNLLRLYPFKMARSNKV